MSTVHLKYGPADHGRLLPIDEYESADYEEGYKYEVIDGRLVVAPIANLTENRAENWLLRKVQRYAEDHPEVIRFATNKARVFVPGRPRLTVPEPDIAAYHDFPADEDDTRWADVSPVLVGEVLVEGDPEKDLVRNVDLFFRVPSVREYWVLDCREGWSRPTLIQHRRYGTRWLVREYPFGSTFTPKLLPGFSLLIDPRK